MTFSLELSPRVCTLSSDKENCDTVVTARWRSPRDESLCLLIVGQPQVRQCWENHTEGEYTVRLMFDRDLLVQLRDLRAAERARVGNHRRHQGSAATATQAAPAVGHPVLSAPAMPAERPRDRPRVLLVEDDERLSELVRSYLDSNGFDVAVEYRGDRVLGRVQSERPDLAHPRPRVAGPERLRRVQGSARRAFAADSHPDRA